MKKVYNSIKTTDMSVDDVISRIIKESSSTRFHILQLRRYFDPFYKRIGRPKREHK